MLHNEPAHTWRRAIQRFFQEAERGDVLLLHLPCHGRKDNRNRLYFVARDSEFDMVEATSVSAEFLADCMDLSRSPRCLEKLAAYLEQGPAAHGWMEDRVWTAARVATLIGRKFQVFYSVSGATS
uniref:winged helix-turn-helix domain-containing protein n=1 Tax=Streptomyces kaniharaensis TaxID=212423 RepID=UPI001E3515EB|nr:winged helix-turn-helix domain-containing protein [Streptomyces kaniharaensis]